MSKRSKARLARTGLAKAEAMLSMDEALAEVARAPVGVSMDTFSFGDAVPVLDGPSLLEAWACHKTDKWYEPPVPRDYLARCLQVNPHHMSAVTYKLNQLMGHLVEHPKLSHAQFEAFALDWLTFGEAYIERIRSRIGVAVRYERVLAKYARRGLDLEQFYLIDPERCGEAHAFRRGDVCQVRTPDVNQEIYGVPNYLPAMSSAVLNEAATLFRRRFYANGAHAGFLMYLTDGQMSSSDVDALRDRLRNVRGQGNFRNILLHAPNGTKDGVQILPFRDVGAQDDFLSIKEVSAGDVLAAHRMPPVLLGMVPKAAGGLGDPAKAADVYHMTEVRPIMQAMQRTVNAWAGEPIISFRAYAPMAVTTGP